MTRVATSLIYVCTTLWLSACSPEARALGPEAPQTPPDGPDDPRIGQYESNRYQVAQGGRYFTWYGCAACHGSAAGGVLSLGDDRWHFGGSFGQVYAAVADRHAMTGGNYRRRIPTAQLWQVTAYVRSLRTLDPVRRRRQDLDQLGEPQASLWRGPIS